MRHDPEGKWLASQVSYLEEWGKGGRCGGGGGGPGQVLQALAAGLIVTVAAGVMTSIAAC